MNQAESLLALIADLNAQIRALQASVAEHEAIIAELREPAPTEPT